MSNEPDGLKSYPIDNILPGWFLGFKKLQTADFEAKGKICTVVRWHVRAQTLTK